MKKIPERTCIGCNIKKAKKELIRIVKNQNGEILVDRVGKVNGRGAYLCDSKDCLEKAIKTKRLEKAFEMTIQEDVYKELEKTIN